MIVTVITPTYNRGENLKKLYHSLCRQTCKDFKWLVLDDGSDDETRKIVSEFMKEKKIVIDLIYKENGGKHTALNMAIKYVDTPLTFIVDSDDWITENAIEQIKVIHLKYRERADLCAYSFMRKFSNGQVNGKKFEKNELIGNYITVRINGKDTESDKAEVWKTDVLKKYPFPVFSGEKFLGEDIVWIQMALKYNMVFLNTAIYIADYLKDGLTHNRRKNNINSPNGCRYRALVALRANKVYPFEKKYFLKVLLQYHIYGFYAGIKIRKQIEEVPNKFYYSITYPVGVVMYLIWKRKYTE